MADRVSKVILQWQVQNERAAAESFERVYGPLTKTQNAVKELRDSLADIRTSDTARKLGSEFGELAKDIEKAADAERQLAESLLQIGASKSDIAAAAREFERFRNASADATSVVSGTATGGTSKLTQIGSKIRSLPSTQIPGAGGLATDAIGNILRVLGALPPAILPVIVLLGGVTAGFVLLGKQLEDVRGKLTAAIEAQNKFYQDLATLNSKQAQAEIDRLKLRNNLIHQQVESELRVVQIGAQGVVDSFGGIFDAISFLLGKQVGESAKVIASGLINKDITDNLGKLKKEFDTNSASINLLEQGLKSGAFAVNDMTEALKQFNNDVADQTLASIKVRADVLQEIAKLEADGSQKELEARREQLRATQQNAETQLKDLKNLVDASKAGSDEQKKYQAAFTQQNEIYKNATYELGLLGKASVDAAVKFNDANKELQKNNDNSADLILKYNDDVTKADEAARKAQADAADKYNEALVKAADTAAKAAENALQKLNDQAEKLATSFQRGNEAAERKRQQDALESAIKFQQADAKAARDHADELLKIKQEEQNKEQDLIASRDFAGLFRARRDTTTKLQEANTQYQQEQQDRLTAYQLKNEEDQRQYEFEAKERQIKYQQSLTDAKAQYSKELALANAALIAANNAALQARNNQLQIAQSKYNAELQMLQGHIQRSLGLYAQGLSAEEQLQQARTAALLQQVNLLRGNFGTPAVSFSGLGSTTNNNGGNSVNNTFNIRGNNPQGIATLVETQVNKSLRTYLVN